MNVTENFSARQCEGILKIEKFRLPEGEEENAFVERIERGEVSP
jgi:hypothetical protein